MIAYVNGQFLPEEDASVSVLTVGFYLRMQYMK